MPYRYEPSLATFIYAFNTVLITILMGFLLGGKGVVTSYVYSTVHIFIITTQTHTQI